MNIKPKTVSMIGLPLIYIIAFYSFCGSSVFSYFSNLAGSGLSAFIIVNAAAGLFILVARLLNNKTDPFVYAVSFFFLIPPVLSYSKLDLIEVVLGIKFTDNHHALTTALSVIFVTAVAIFINRISRFYEESEKWHQNGAEYQDAMDIYKRRLGVLLFTMAVAIIPLILIVTAGFTITTVVRIPMEPLILLLAGITLAASGIFYLVFSTAFKKNK